MAGFLRLLALLATFLAVSGLSAYDPRNLLLPYEVSGTEEVLKGFTEWHPQRKAFIRVQANGDGLPGQEEDANNWVSLADRCIPLNKISLLSNGRESLLWKFFY